MVYHYIAIGIDKNGLEIPGTEQYIESVTKYQSGEIENAGCSFVKIMYEV